MKRFWRVVALAFALQLIVGGLGLMPLLWSAPWWLQIVGFALLITVLTAPVQVEQEVRS